MQARHEDRKKYFDEQALTTERYVIPYVNEVFFIDRNMRVLEVGCGEGGNLLPFVTMGCEAVGVDLGKDRIENANHFFAEKGFKNVKFFAKDIFDCKVEQLGQFDFIFLRDVIEHLPDQEVFLRVIRSFLKDDGAIFFGFPPWRMPFGGHQQICQNRWVSKLPYVHLLPYNWYRKFLKQMGESDATIETLLEIKDTGISIGRFKRAYQNANYQPIKETHYLINPNYETKFGLKQRLVPSLSRIPKIEDFYTTAVYSLLKKC